MLRNEDFGKKIYVMFENTCMEIYILSSLAVPKKKTQSNESPEKNMPLDYEHTSFAHFVNDRNLCWLHSLTQAISRVFDLNRERTISLKKTFLQNLPINPYHTGKQLDPAEALIFLLRKVPLLSKFKAKKLSKKVKKYVEGPDKDQEFTTYDDLRDKDLPDVAYGMLNVAFGNVSTILQETHRAKVEDETGPLFPTKIKSGSRKGKTEGKRRKHYAKITLTHYPGEYLILNNPANMKIQDKDALVITHPETGAVYDLVSVVEHSNPAFRSSGHYTAYVIKDKIIYYIDDMQKKVSIVQKMSTKKILLFYVRRTRHRARART
jgi:ubiquitin C-terminal hydrolase